MFCIETSKTLDSLQKFEEAAGEFKAALGSRHPLFRDLIYFPLMSNGDFVSTLWFFLSVTILQRGDVQSFKTCFQHSASKRGPIARRPLGSYPMIVTPTWVSRTHPSGRRLMSASANQSSTGRTTSTTTRITVPWFRPGLTGTAACHGRPH